MVRRRVRPRGQVLTWLLRAVLDVRTASHVGALLAGEPQMGPTVSCIAWRETRFELTGVHAGDSWMARTLGEGWSTRGSHGMVARFAWPHVPRILQWLPPAILDVPLVSAFVATRRARSWQCKATPACIRWRGCGR